MQNAHELFLHELSDMFDAEQKILEALTEQSKESQQLYAAERVPVPS